MEFFILLPEYGLIMIMDVQSLFLLQWMSASPPSTTQNMDVPIHYQNIFWQPNENFHLLFSKYKLIYYLSYYYPIIYCLPLLFCTEKVHEVVGATYKQIKSNLPKVFKKMSLYLANKDTEYILFRPIKVSLVKYRKPGLLCHPTRRMVYMPLEQSTHI